MSNKKSIYNLFQTDNAKERDGVVIEYDDLGKITIARAGGANTRYNTAIYQKMQPYRRQLQLKQNKLDDKTIKLMRRLNMELFAETVVLGWEGICDAEGVELPFSKEACLNLFNDLPALFDDLLARANDLSTFQAEEIEEDAKNL